MRKSQVLSLILVAGFLALTNQARADDYVYLRCKADPEYMGGPHILIDKEKKTITIVPIKDALPLREDETSYEGSVEIQQQVMFRVTINKFTLRYTTQSLLEPRFAAGQCVIEQKKL